MKTLKFDQAQVELVKNRAKTATWRFFDEKDLRVGDKLLLVEVPSGQPFGMAEVLQVAEKRMKDLDDNDFDGHELFNSQAEMYELYGKYYAGKTINENTIVKVVHFDYHELPNDFDKLPSKHKHGREVKLYADGGSRGNPGPSAGGFVILDMDNNVVKKSGKYLGVTTNNQAEYHSLKGGLEAAQAMGMRTVHVFMDSLLVVNQMLGIYKIKNRDLWPIHQAIKELVASFDTVTFTHVPRELNKLADGMVNETLDAQKPA